MLVKYITTTKAGQLDTNGENIQNDNLSMDLLDMRVIWSHNILNQFSNKQINEIPVSKDLEYRVTRIEMSIQIWNGLGVLK